MKELQTIEYAGSRVLTTRQLAEVCETDASTIINNFFSYYGYFVEGKDYFELVGDNIDECSKGATECSKDLCVRPSPMLFLWTERGADRHCRILDSAIAWEQFDDLEETYFRADEDMTILDFKDALANLLERQKVLELKVEDHEKRLEALEAKINSFLEDYSSVVDASIDTITSKDGCTELRVKMLLQA